LPKYFEPNTVSGTIQTALITAQMTDDSNTLKYRQSIIRYLSENSELLEKLNNALKASKPGEESLLSSFSFSQTQLELINGIKISAHEKLYFTSNAFKAFNNKYILDPLKRIKTSNLIMLPSIIYMACLVKYQHDIPFSTMLEVCNMENVKKLITAMQKYPKESAAIAGSIGAAFAFNYMMAKPDIKQDFDLIYTQKKELIAIATLINNIQVINKLIDDNQELKKLFPKEHKQLKQLFNASSKTTSSNLKYVLSELQSSSFKGDPSYYLSLQ
jgi:hypothetical protein